MTRATRLHPARREFPSEAAARRFARTLSVYARPRLEHAIASRRQHSRKMGRVTMSNRTSARTTVVWEVWAEKVER